MKFVKKWIAAALVTMMLVVVFAGCGKVSEQPKASSGDAPSKVASGDTSAAKVQKLKLGLWDYGVVEYDKKLVEAFSEKYPNIQLEVVSAPNADYENKLAVMLAGGEDLDVYYAKSTQSYPNLVLRNYALPIDDLIAKDNIDIKPYGNIVNRQMIIDGKLYGLPYRGNVYLLFYNKNMFDQANIPYPTNDMTWEQFKEVGKKLTSGEGNNKTYGIFSIPRMNYYLPIWIQKEEDSDLTTSDLSLLKPGIQMHMDIEKVDKSSPDYATSKSMNADQLTFYKGNYGMMYNGVWFINMLVNDKKGGKFDFDWGVVQSPYWKDGEKSAFGTATPVVINSKTTKVDAAWELMKFLTGKEGAKILAQEAIMPGYMDNDILDIFAKNPDFPDGTVDALRDNQIYVLTPPDKLANVIQKMVQEETELIITDNKSIDQGIADMMKRRQEIIDQNK